MVASSSRPAWYTAEDDTAWAKVKAAFRRDWQQTKHDFGGQAPDLDQDVGDTISQAVGSQPIPPGNTKTPGSTDSRLDAYTDDYSDEDEPAYRYGYAASRHYSDKDWDEETERMLQAEWGEQPDWQRRSAAIRRGWTYGKSHVD